MSRQHLYLGPQPPPQPDPPRIRAWRSYAKEPGVVRMEVDVEQPREGVAMGAAKLFVSFLRQDRSVARMDECVWDADLDKWLIGEHVRASSRESEKLRFALHLRSEMQPVFLRFGESYFDAVLISMIREDLFTDHPEVQDMLKSIRHTLEPSPARRQDCQQAIDHALGVVGGDIVKLYPGESAAAEDILGGALARFLDERFRVTSRRQHGWG